MTSWMNDWRASLDCVGICWRGKGSCYWNANQTVCVWTVSMRFFGGVYVCVFVSAFVYPTTVGDPIVSVFRLLWFLNARLVKISVLGDRNPPFCTSNKTNGVEKLADWLIVVVSAHARKLKQLILCLLGTGLMVCAGSCCGVGGCWRGGTVEFWIRLIVRRDCVNMKGEVECAGVVWEDSSMVNDHLLVVPHLYCVCMNVCVS